MPPDLAGRLSSAGSGNDEMTHLDGERSRREVEEGDGEVVIGACVQGVEGGAGEVVWVEAGKELGQEWWSWAHGRRKLREEEGQERRSLERAWEVVKERRLVGACVEGGG